MGLFNARAWFNARRRAEGTRFNDIFENTEARYATTATNATARPTDLTSLEEISVSMRVDVISSKSTSTTWTPSFGPRATASGLSTLIKDQLAGHPGWLRCSSLQILPVLHPTVRSTHGGGPARSVVALIVPGSPRCVFRAAGWRPGAALRDLVLVQRGQATSVRSCSEVTGPGRRSQPDAVPVMPSAATPPRTAAS